jgi:group I intron endonuclease
MIDKKESKKKYKQTVQPMGVYQIRCTANGKIFIGSSKNLPGKFNSLKFQLKMGSYFPLAELQSDYAQYGEEKFSFEVLDYLEPKEDPLYDYSDDLAVLEDLWVQKLQPFGEKGYNKKKEKIRT